MSIGRSSTGIYHNVYGNASSCNGRSFRGYKVGIDLISMATEEMFCKKCFSANRRDASRKDNAIFVFNMEKSYEQS